MLVCGEKEMFVIVSLTRFLFSSSSCFSTVKSASTYITDAQLVIATKSVTMDRRAMFLCSPSRTIEAVCLLSMEIWIFIGIEFVKLWYISTGRIQSDMPRWLFTQLVTDKVNKILNYSFIYHAVVCTVVKLCVSCKLYLPFPYNSCTIPNDPCFSVASN